MEYLGRRQPELYGTTTAKQLDAILRRQARELECRPGHPLHQHRGRGRVGDLQGRPRQYRRHPVQSGGLPACRVRAARLPESIRAPAIEIHMTNIEKRGFGSVTAEAAVGMIAGFGVDSTCWRWRRWWRGCAGLRSPDAGRQGRRRIVAEASRRRERRPPAPGALDLDAPQPFGAGRAAALGCQSMSTVPWSCRMSPAAKSMKSRPARGSPRSCPACCRSGCRGNRGWPACRPSRRRSPACRRDATCRGRRPPIPARERLATKNVSEAASARARHRRAQRGARPGAGRGARRRHARLDVLRAIAEALGDPHREPVASTSTTRPLARLRRRVVKSRPIKPISRAGDEAGAAGIRRRRTGRRCAASPDRAIARSPARRSGPKPSASRVLQRGGEQAREQLKKSRCWSGMKGRIAARPARWPARPAPDLVLVEGQEGRHPAGSCEALRPLGEQRLGVVPGRAVGSPDMDLRPVRHLGVEAAQPQQNTGCATRSAMRCEPQRVQKRRNLPGDNSTAPSRSSPRIQRNVSRGTAVTEEKACRASCGRSGNGNARSLERRVGFVGDGAAKAASGQHRLLHVASKIGPADCVDKMINVQMSVPDSGIMPWIGWTSWRSSCASSRRAAWCAPQRGCGARRRP